MVAALACLSLAVAALAQTTPASPGNSLGAAAHNLKGQNATPTKHVFTNDDMEATNEPLPRLNMNISQPDNSADVVAAILSYRQTHTPKQTEDAVHSWFDLYDRTLADAIQAFNDHQSARQTSAKTIHEPCPTGEFKADCEKQQQAEWKNLLKSDPNLNQDNRTMGRIQSGLKNVRDGLRMKNVRYSWFTIRSSNGYDTF
jgi:hypothetical protein